ncbi:MAG: hypothetical protein H6654_01770 [Ardenticatenaceae bacterium]|nr:hypothetical protein [Anaerolineales bacterium]MCB8940913.1 hypothetical protein [Ardenticatenaceae bacterium]MCB8972252.1 hypothetical protein [Ardenticatenaceae bacterium]
MAGKYIITGRVHPERADISFGRIEMELANSQSAIASCVSSQITVTLDMPNLDGWIAAMIMAEDIATIIVGALGFSLGSGYWVELIQVTEENGTPHVFGVRPKDPTTGTTLKVEPQIEVFNRAFRLSGHNLFFRLAIRDYLRAITDVKDCVTYCYRAIESIKSAFVFKTGNDSWDEMHRVLGTERTSITSVVKDYADPVRHGNWIEARPTDNLIRFQMLELTRDILIKYLNHEQPTT